ncbi:PAS domain S-box protein [bacterium]|nr:PAS domain S-box protein [bacterium]
MKDERKTKAKLVEEISELRKRIRELEALEDEHKRMEEALAESEERYVKAEQTGHFGHWVRNFNEDRAVWSKEACRILGIEPDHPPSYEDFLSLVHPADREALKGATDAATYGTKPVDFVYRIIRPDGTERVIHSVANVRYDRSGQPVGIEGTVHDITERNRLEQELRQERDNLLRIFTAMEDGVYIVNQQYDIQYVNPSLIKDFGSWEGRKCYEYFHDRSEVCPWCKNERVFAGETVRWEWHSSKNDRTYDLIDTPLMSPDGSVHKLEIFRDITERKRAEQALKREKEQVEQYLNVAGVILVIINADESIALINKKGCEILGYGNEEILGKNWFDLMVPLTVRSEVRSVFRKIMAGDVEPVECFENPLLTKDGEERLVAFHNTVIRDAQGRIVGTLSSGEDITERRRGEKALLESRERYMALFEQAAESVVVIDAETGAIVEFNDRAHEALGYTRSEFRELKIPDIDVVESSEEVVKHLESIVDTGSDVFETRHRTKSGEIRDIQVSCKAVTIGGRYYVQSIWRDITDSKRAKQELEASRQQMRALSMRVLSAQEEERTRISREIHDELAQTLTALAFDLAWLGNRLPEGEVALQGKVKTMSEHIGEATKAVQRISAELRPGMLDDLGLVSAAEWYLKEFQNRTGIECDLKMTTEDLALDDNRSTTVFRILQEALTNVARHAEATEVCVRLEKEQGTLFLEVRDNGRGITEEQASSGKSLGLTGMRERARLWRGNVTIEGSEGKGTVVSVRIPMD